MSGISPLMPPRSRRNLMQVRLPWQRRTPCRRFPPSRLAARSGKRPDPLLPRARPRHDSAGKVQIQCSDRRSDLAARSRSTDMDDTIYGTRDKRGHWKPLRLVDYGPLFVWPAKPLALLEWFFGYPGYILPWNLFYAM